MRSIVRFHVALCAPLMGVLASCSDATPDVADAPLPPPVPERVPENDARTDSAAPCVTGMPAATSFCALPLDEEEEYELIDRASTTSEGCTKLYVASRPKNGTRARVRRYRMTGSSPCGFSRDETFGEVPAYLSAIAASDDGAVYALGYRVVRRIAPGPPVDCRARGVELGEHALIAIAPTGRTGYVAWNVTTTPSFAKLSASEGGCELSPIDVPASTSRDIVGIAVDTQGRLHVAEGGFSTAGEAYLIGSNGYSVTTYDPPRDEWGRWNQEGITLCGDGTCIPYRRTLASFTVDGRLVAQLEEPAHEGLFFPYAFVGSAGGPLFRLGFGWGSHPGLRVQIVDLTER